MNQTGFNQTHCKVLYEPNPDIAGKGILVSLITHAGCYVVFGMIIAPLVHLYFRQITPSEESVQGQEPAVLQARTALVRSKTRECIVESFRGSQYIIGLSYVTIGFVKHSETSYYHVRIIYALASINLASAFIFEYSLTALSRHQHDDAEKKETEVDTGARVLSKERALETRKSKSKESLWRNRARHILGRISYNLSIVSYFAYSIYTGIRGRSDPDFHRCYTQSWLTYALTVGLAFVAILANSTSLHPKRFGIFKLFTPLLALLSWPVTMVIALAMLSLQSMILYRVTETFQSKSPQMSSEYQFGFGQLLIFFMVFQLITDFGIALYMDFSKLTRELNLVADSNDTQFTVFVRNFRHLILAFPSIVKSETRASLAAYREERVKRGEESWHQSTQSSRSSSSSSEPRGSSTRNFYSTITGPAKALQTAIFQAKMPWDRSMFKPTHPPRSDTESMIESADRAQTSARETHSEENIDLSNLSRRQTGIAEDEDGIQAVLRSEDDIEIRPIPQ